MSGLDHSIRTWLEPLRGRIMTGIVLLIGLYFVLAFGEQAWHARELEAEVGAREADLTALQLRRDDLQERVTTYNSEAYLIYVEQAARRELNLSYPEETVVLVRWAAAPEPPAHDASESTVSRPEQSNWQKWVDFLAR
jgi:cell division protein FtsB